MVSDQNVILIPVNCSIEKQNNKNKPLGVDSFTLSNMILTTTFGHRTWAKMRANIDIFGYSSNRTRHTHPLEGKRESKPIEWLTEHYRYA